MNEIWYISNSNRNKEFREELGDLRSDDNEAMRSDLGNELRVKGVVEKVAMKEQHHWEISFFDGRANQERFRRWNCNYQKYKTENLNSDPFYKLEAN